MDAPYVRQVGLSLSLLSRKSTYVMQGRKEGRKESRERGQRRESSIRFSGDGGAIREVDGWAALFQANLLSSGFTSHNPSPSAARARRTVDRDGVGLHANNIRLLLGRPIPFPSDDVLNILHQTTGLSSTVRDLVQSSTTAAAPLFVATLRHQFGNFPSHRNISCFAAHFLLPARAANWPTFSNRKISFTLATF